MKNQFSKQGIPFTQVANELLCNPSVSIAAKGMFAYLFSKPNDWDFSSDRIQNEHKDGKRAVLSALRELEQSGYLTRKRLGTGRVLYFLKHNQSALEALGTPTPSAPSAQGESALISNKDIYKDKIHSDAGRRGKFTSLGADIIKEFEGVDPKNKTYYNNTSQRAAADFLVSEYGFDEVKKRISVLERTNKLAYFPTITTPVQLRDKWVQLQDAVERKRNSSAEKGAKVAFV